MVSRILYRTIKTHVEVIIPDKCNITVRVKPYGFGWRTIQKTAEVKTLIVDHG
jgi:hypothetical protein